MARCLKSPPNPLAAALCYDTSSMRFPSDDAPRRYGVIFLPCCVILIAASLYGAAQRSAGDSSNSPEVESHLAAAQEAQNRKDYATAEREYRAALSLAPDVPQAYLNLGLIYQLQDRRPEAMEMFQKALQLDPKLAGANFFLGVDYCRQGRGDLAVPHLKAALRDKPDLAEAWSWLATAQEMAGQGAGQVSTLEAGLRAHPENVDLLYLLGHAYEKVGKDAVDRLQQISPRSPYVEWLLGDSYSTSHYYSVALYHLQNALASSPGIPGLHLAAGEVYLHAGNLKGAKEEIEKELKLHPGSLRATVRLGEIKLLSGDREGALADWGRALAVDPQRVEAILGLREYGFGDMAQERLPDSLRGTLEALRSQIDEGAGPAARLAAAFVASQAGTGDTFDLNSLHTSPSGETAPCTLRSLRRWLEEDRLKEAAACGPRVLRAGAPASLRLEVARALYEEEQPAEALQVLKGISVAAAQAPEALFWRARSYKKLALATYLRLARTAPDSWRTHELLGDMYQAREDDAKAIEEYRAALAQKPGLPNLHYQVGHLLWKGYKVEEARREFNAELALNPRHAGALFDLGNTYLYEHQPDKGLTYLRQVAAIDPDYPDVHQFLGMAYAQLKQYRQAEAELQRASARDRDGKIYYQLAKVYQALGRSGDAARAFAASDALNRESHRRNEERTARLAAAEAVLKQP